MVAHVPQVCVVPEPEALSKEKHWDGGRRAPASIQVGESRGQAWTLLRGVSPLRAKITLP